jgi:hypothetical protein
MNTSTERGRADPGDVGSLYSGVSEATSSSGTQDGEANGLKDSTTSKQQAVPAQAPGPTKSSHQKRDGATDRTVTIWNAKQTGYDESLFTGGGSGMLQIYAEGRKIVALLPTYEYMQLMAASVEAGCKHRALCRERMPEKEYVHESLQLAVKKMKEIEVRLRQEKKALSAQGPDHDATLAETHKKSRNDYKDARSDYIPIKEYHEDLIKELRTSEKKWLQSMCRLCDDHRDLLINCGLKDDEEESCWEDSDYEIDGDIAGDEHSSQDAEDGTEQGAILKKAPGSEQEVLSRTTCE